MRIRVAVVPVIALVAALASCAAPSDDPPADALGKSESPIINGVLDTTDTAVVAVLGQSFSCSGTIVQVKNGVGYVLTAAHCCAPGALPKWVVVGNDYNSPTSQTFNVTTGSVKRDGCYLDYAGGTDDVCMLKFSGATGLPTIPVAPPPDGLSVGTMTTYVGYGITASPPGGGNSKRRSVTKAIGNLDAYFIEYANPGASGTCEGDSGGPALAQVGGMTQVVGVTSYGDQSCTQLGASIRTQSVYQNFIAPYLADTPQDPPSCPVDTDCNVCGSYATQQAGCQTSLNACFNDAECSALADCYNNCTTLACQNQCNTDHLAGLAKYVAIEDCICFDQCSTACATASYCTSAKCGLKITDDACDKCVDSKCCDLAWTCQADTTCRKCFGSNPPAGCATNANAEAYYQCATSKCGCTVNDPATIGGTTSATTSGTGGSGAGGAGDQGATTDAGAGGSSGKVKEDTGGCAVAVSSSESGAASIAFAFALVAAAGRARRRPARRARD